MPNAPSIPHRLLTLIGSALALLCLGGAPAEETSIPTWNYQFLDDLPQTRDLQVPCRTQWVAVSPVDGHLVRWEEGDIEFLDPSFRVAKTWAFSPVPTCFQFGPAMKRLYVGENNATVTCFDLKSGEQLWSCTLAPDSGSGADYVHGLDISPDGRTLAVSTPRRVGFLDLVGEQLLGQRGESSLAIFEAQSKKVAIVGQDGSIHLFTSWATNEDLAKGKKSSVRFDKSVTRPCLHRVDGHAGWVAVTEKEVKRIDVKSGKGRGLAGIPKPMRSKPKSMRSANIPGQSALLVSGLIRNRGRIYRIDLSKGAGDDRLSKPVDCGENVPSTLTSGPQGSSAFATSGGTLFARSFEEKSSGTPPEIAAHDRKYTRILRNGSAQFCLRERTSVRLFTWNPFTGATQVQKVMNGRVFYGDPRVLMLRRGSDLLIVDRQTLDVTVDRDERASSNANSLRNHVSKFCPPDLILWEEFKGERRKLGQPLDARGRPDIRGWSTKDGRVLGFGEGLLDDMTVLRDRTRVRLEKDKEGDVVAVARNVQNKEQWRVPLSVRLQGAPFTSRRFPSQALVTSPDESRLLIHLSDHSVHLVDLDQKDVIQSWDDVHRASFSSSGSELILMLGARAGGGQIRLFESVSGDGIAQVQLPEGATASQVIDCASGGALLVFEGTSFVNGTLSTSTFLVARR